MNRRIQEVRKSIVKRNKVRREKWNDTTDNRTRLPFVQEEEKHGYYSDIHDESSPGKWKVKSLHGILLKALLSVVLFLGVAFLSQSNAPLFSMPKKWVATALTEEFPFARVHLWYRESFGDPLSLIPKENSEKENNDLIALPVSGNVTETFQSNGSGIMISPEGESSVTSWREGVVIFAGKDKAKGQTVIIQHADSSKSTYSLLSSIDVHLYQYVTANQMIGSFNPTEASDVVYFSIEQKDEFIDPVQVIQVDDRS